jgi:pilus assembly protein CpaE
VFVRLNTVLVDADAANLQELSSFLTEHGATVVAALPGADRLGPFLRQGEPPQLVIVNLDPHAHEALRTVGALIGEFPSVSFFVMSHVVDPNLLMEAIHLRVKEFIPLPMVPEKLLAGLERVAHLESDTKRAKVIHVIPTIGGCGSTTVSCNVAVSLAKSGAKVVILDLDLVCGGVATAFDLHPKYTIADVMSSGGTLDKHLLENALAIHQPSGLAILARPDAPDASQQVGPEGFNRLMNVLTHVYDYVVIDSMMSLDPLCTAAVRAADVNLMVMQLNVPSARNAERFVGALRRMGVESDAIKIVVNRFEKRTGNIIPDDVEKALGLPISWTIPNDFKNAIAAINFGEPVVLRSPRADMSGSLAGLVRMLNGRRDAH